jgi:hypothetical protein
LLSGDRKLCPCFLSAFQHRLGKKKHPLNKTRTLLSRCIYCICEFGQMVSLMHWQLNLCPCFLFLHFSIDLAKNHPLKKTQTNISQCIIFVCYTKFYIDAQNVLG